MTRNSIVAAARACVGVRFRPQGRDAATGLDCVGLAGAAYGAIDLPRDYALRGASAERIGDGIVAAGLIAVNRGAAGPGDLLLCRAGAGQWHLVVLSDIGFVHADAGLRRVVEVPGRPGWPVAGAWRKEES